MLTSLLSLSVASFVCMLFSQTRSIGALGMIVIIVLNPKLFLAMAVLTGVGYYILKK
jgi:hypothetical protein